MINVICIQNFRVSTKLSLLYEITTGICKIGVYDEEMSLIIFVYDLPFARY